MGLIEIEAHAQSRAAPAKVYALLKDGSTWPHWAMFDSFELERPGRDEPFGVGAIRVFATRVSRAREEVVELVPDAQLSYVLLSGLPFRDYRADVVLTPTSDAGAAIAWRASFAPKHNGTGWFWRWFMRRVLRTVAGQLAKAAENPAPPPRPPGEAPAAGSR